MKTRSLFVFGDSYSDVGRLKKLTGESVLPSDRYYRGRASNGPVAVEYLAKGLGLHLSARTNFAVGGARTGGSVNGVDGVTRQVKRFRVHAKGLRAGDRDLYLIWAGTNDLIRAIASPGEANKIIDQGARNLVRSVRQLGKVGAKNIVVVQPFNLGRLPLAIAQQPLSRLTRQFNQEVRRSLSHLPLQPTIVNLYRTSEAIARSPESFGLSNAGTPAIDTPETASGALWWDGGHPTTRGHRIFARVIKKAIFAIL